MRVENHSRIIAGVEDLFFASKIDAAARRVGIAVEFARSPSELLANAAQLPSLIILDLNASGLDPITVIRELRVDPTLQTIPLLGFVSHVESELIQAARAAGCDEILARSTFSKDLPAILRRYSEGRTHVRSKE